MANESERNGGWPWSALLMNSWESFSKLTTHFITPPVLFLFFIFLVRTYQVNTRSDDTAKLGTDFNPNEIALYKKIVDRIILSTNYRYCLSYHDCLRLTSTLQANIKKSEAEKLLTVLVEKGTSISLANQSDAARWRTLCGSFQAGCPSLKLATIHSLSVQN